LSATATASGLTVDSKAQGEHVRSVSTERLSKRLGRVSNVELTHLDDALRLHLDL
jgi:mRNA interferase MazF